MLFSLLRIFEYHVPYFEISLNYGPEYRQKTFLGGELVQRLRTELMLEFINTIGMQANEMIFENGSNLRESYYVFCFSTFIAICMRLLHYKSIIYRKIFLSQIDLMVR